MRVMLVTGGAGFIGSNFVKYFLRRNKNYIVVNIDKLTYASNINNIKEIESSPRHHFIKGDICNTELIDYVLRKYRPGFIVNFAAESHVDRSISNPASCFTTNVMGTLALLEGARFIWSRHGYSTNRFIQVSSDEVYGSTAADNEYFLEETPLSPNNPYSASKASADLIVRAYAKTYNLPVITTRCCNNYGPFQNTEKFIPMCISNAIEDKPITIYGDGSNIREWIHVQDHCVALVKALFYAKPGEIYNIGSGEEISNLELARKILDFMGKSEDRIKFVNDRPGHDKRYSLNSYKIRTSLSWTKKFKLDDGLKETIDWYGRNLSWWNNRGLFNANK